MARAILSAPRVVGYSATVTAVVRDATRDNTADIVDGTIQTGKIVETGYYIIMMVRDLERLHFPLPVQDNDKIIIVATGEKLNVTNADMHKRSLGGAIELRAAGAE